MSRFRQDKRAPALRLLDAYWTDLRAQAGGDVPTRSALDPRGLETVLDRIFILERIAPGFARIRLSGMRLNLLTGMEVRGLPFSALFTPAARQTLAPLVTRLFSDPARIEMTIEAETGPGRPGFAGQVLLLPLRDNRGLISRAVGAYADTGADPGRTPRRFAISSDTARCFDIAGTWPADGRADRANDTGPDHRAFAEEAEPLLRPGPRLRVVHPRKDDA